MADWTIYAPIVIVILVAILGFFSARRAVADDGWYQYMNHAPFSPPNWLFFLIWAIIYILITITWVRANSTTTNHTYYNSINWLFTVNIVLSLAWAFLFFGDGNLIAGLVIMVLLIITSGALVYLVRSDTWGIIFMILYFIWLLYIFILNWYVVANNFVIRNYPPITSMFG